MEGEGQEANCPTAGLVRFAPVAPPWPGPHWPNSPQNGENSTSINDLRGWWAGGVGTRPSREQGNRAQPALLIGTASFPSSFGTRSEFPFTVRSAFCVGSSFCVWFRLSSSFFKSVHSWRCSFSNILSLALFSNILTRPGVVLQQFSNILRRLVFNWFQHPLSFQYVSSAFQHSVLSTVVRLGLRSLRSSSPSFSPSLSSALRSSFASSLSFSQHPHALQSSFFSLQSSSTTPTPCSVSCRSGLLPSGKLPHGVGHGAQHQPPSPL